MFNSKTASLIINENRNNHSNIISHTCKYMTLEDYKYCCTSC